MMLGYLSRRAAQELETGCRARHPKAAAAHFALAQAYLRRLGQIEAGLELACAPLPLARRRRPLAIEEAS